MITRPGLEWSPGAGGPVFAAEPVALEVPEWMSHGLCGEVGGDDWFPEKGGSTREAKKVCRSCLVRPDCLTYALENDERFGIWGGLSELERRHFKREAAA